MTMDERVKKFKANLNFFCNWEELAKKPWSEFNPHSQIDSRLVVYCGLKDEVEGIDLTECGRMIDPDNGPESWDYIFQVINRGSGPKNREGTPPSG